MEEKVASCVSCTCAIVTVTMLCDHTHDHTQ